MASFWFVSFKFYIIMYLHNGFYLLYRPFQFLFVPIYSFVYGVFLLFVRIYAAITIKPKRRVRYERRRYEKRRVKLQRSNNYLFGDQTM